MAVDADAPAESGPSLVDFLAGQSLTSVPSLHTRVLHHCLVSHALPACCWADVLRAVGAQEACGEVVLEVVHAHRAHASVHTWASAARTDEAIPVPLRLQLHFCIEPELPAPPRLCSDAAAALLAGKALPPEAWKVLEAAQLWPHALERDAHLAAAMLVDRLPEACREAAGIVPFLQTGLVHAKRMQRRACIHVLRMLRGPASSALLSLLSEQQPLHLLDAVGVPPAEFHDAAAQLALRYSDTRVHDLVLGKLSVTDTALLTFVTDAACSAAATSQWVNKWQLAAGRALGERGLDALAVVLEKPFVPGALMPLLTIWEKGCEGAISAPTKPTSLRALRRHAPDIAARVADKLLGACGAGAPEDLLVEALLCEPASLQDHPELCLRAARACARRDLPKLARIAPAAVAESLATAEASMALWAAEALPGLSVASTDGGFVLQLPAGPPFALTSWAAARGACAADPTLAGAYPRCDPDYASARPALLALGPAAAAHAGSTDAELLQRWLSRPLARAEQVEWLSAAKRLLEAGLPASGLKALVVATAIGWAATALKDAELIRAALSALVAAGGGPAALESMWVAVRSCSVASSAVQLLATDEVPPALLGRILGCSSLSAALATAHMDSATPHLPTLAALAVRAAAATGGHGGQPDHPSLQLCRGLARLSGGLCQDLLAQFLDIERPALPPEGSPKGEPHHRHMRLWLCIGCLLEAHHGFAAAVAGAAEVALRSAMQLPTRVLLQNVWARAAWFDPLVLQRLAGVVADLSMPETFAVRCVAVAAQLILHPAHADLPRGHLRLDESEGLRPLLVAMVAWSATYVHGPRLLASLALYHALELALIANPGWYLEALHRSVATGAAFQKLRGAVQMDRWVSNAWSLLQHPEAKRPLDVAVALAMKQVSDSFWTPAVAAPPGAEVYQRRPVLDPCAAACQPDGTDVVVVGSLLDNLPNMAGLVRTAEALLGPHGEVTLHSQAVLSDPSFLKMSVAAERAGRVVVVPQGPRLLEYIREKRAEGFTIVALEQTSTSLVLGAGVRLPERLLLLVGGEQQGLPVWLVHSGLVDLFVELPLLGQTGSLNAHVATAMVLWSYCLQRWPARE